MSSFEERLEYPKTIKDTDVFYFATEKISSEEPHYFVCIKRQNDDILVFTCCTTQEAKRQAYFDRKGYSLRSLVAIRKEDAGAKFKKDCFIDCNSVQEFTLDEFTEICKTKDIEFKGELDIIYYEQLLIGLQESPELAEDLKERLPKPEDL